MKKRFVIVLTAIMVMVLSVSALAAEIIVTGIATSSLPADQATLELGATFKANSAQEAQRLTDATIKQVLDALEELGIDKKDISTSNYSVYVEVPYQEYGSIGQADPVYNASNILLVKIRDLEQVAAVIDVGTQAGANQIYSLMFSASKASEAYNKALELAVEDARMKAEVLAKASGKTLGSIQAIDAQENYGDIYYVANPMSKTAETSEGAAVVTGEVSVTARVTLTYDLE